MTTNTEKLVIARACLHEAQLYGNHDAEITWSEVIKIIEARIQREIDEEDHDTMRDLLAGPRA